ncbi:hypothetical protein AMECASPLE_023812 [Ameca splendens]|uniref:Uncharacterized protein n=1 Tax=Ameca splendens TaxID=208324 RepID=A0ABV1A0N8_9TELE
MKHLWLRSNSRAYCASTVNRPDVCEVKYARLCGSLYLPTSSSQSNSPTPGTDIKSSPSASCPAPDMQQKSTNHQMKGFDLIKKIPSHVFKITSALNRMKEVKPQDVTKVVYRLCRCIVPAKASNTMNLHEHSHVHHG